MSKVVIEQDDGRHLARAACTTLAHGDANVRGLKRRDVIHAVARDGDDLAARLKRANQRQLLRRRRARDHMDAAQQCALALIDGDLHLLARNHRGRRSPESNVARNGACGDRMIAGDDDDSNACGLAGGNGGGDTVTHRILKGEQSGEAEVARRFCAGPCVQRLPRAGDDLVTGLGERRHLIDPMLALLGRHRDERQNDLRGPFRVRDLTAFVTVDRRLPLAVLGERKRGDAFGDRGARDPILVNADEDGDVQGVAAFPT